jgi:hypothetical protein
LDEFGEETWNQSLLHTWEIGEPAQFSELVFLRCKTKTTEFSWMILCNHWLKVKSEGKDEVKHFNKRFIQRRYSCILKLKATQISDKKSLFIHFQPLIILITQKLPDKH